MKRFLYILSIASIILMTTYGCTKDIELEFPEVENQLVVDGSIEPGGPPFIFLTKSQSFNSGLNPEELNALLVNGADIKVNDGEEEYQLTEICVSQLSDAQILDLSQALGISVFDLVSIEYCIYTNLNLLGEIGKTYDLTIEYEGQTLNSSTSLLESVPLDSLWWEPNVDSLGFIRAILTDPPELGNSYRWFAQRISKIPGTESLEDDFFISPLGGAFDDQFFNGLTFEFFAARGSEINSNAEEDNNGDAGLFRLGDTVIVKFTTIPAESYEFYFVLEDQIANNGSPFANPTNAPSNIEGGLGVWTGYSPFYDTLVVE